MRTPAECRPRKGSVPELSPTEVGPCLRGGAALPTPTLAPGPLLAGQGLRAGARHRRRPGGRGPSGWPCPPRAPRGGPRWMAAVSRAVCSPRREGGGGRQLSARWMCGRRGTAPSAGGAPRACWGSRGCGGAARRRLAPCQRLPLPRQSVYPAVSPKTGDSDRTFTELGVWRPGGCGPGASRLGSGGLRCQEAREDRAGRRARWAAPRAAHGTWSRPRSAAWVPGPAVAWDLWLAGVARARQSVLLLGSSCT